MSGIPRTIVSVLVVAAGLGLWSAQAVGQPSASPRPFDSPEAAVKALVAAMRAGDDRALVEIFGSRHADLFSSVDQAHRESRATFVRAADEYQLLRREDDGRVTLVVGYDAWPSPIPLVKEGSAWRFDTDAGREELLDRRIGHNELAVIETLRAYADAQRRYASRPRDASGVRQFARKVRSTPGKRDGLYWDADPGRGEEPSPFGPLIRDAAVRQPGAPYHGYFFKILTRQGPAAPAGRYDYVINGRLLAGFAMVAFPAQYGSTGIKTFIVNHYGVVHERDLGPRTASLAAAMTEYNPSAAWQPVGEP